MKGLILSGGSGKRLRPITYSSAKQLVPIANKPILFYGIEQMASVGIRDVGIVISPITGSEIQRVVGDGSAFGVRITWIFQQYPLGLAHCVEVASVFLDDEDFVMYLGDNMLQTGLAPFARRFTLSRARKGSRVAAQILLTPVSNPSLFGVANLAEDGSITELIEKPANPPSNLALVGVYFFDKIIHEAVRNIKPSSRGELEITDAICWLISQGHRVEHDVLRGWRIDTGKKDSLLECNRLVLDTLQREVSGQVDHLSTVEGATNLHQRASITNSVVCGPVIIGAGANIVNSKIGPYVSIAEDCVVADSEIENSVLMSRCSVKGLQGLSDSLVGRDTTLATDTKAADSDSTPTTQSVWRVLVGDHCQVEMQQ